jgi:hypothetical protein
MSGCRLYTGAGDAAEHFVEESPKAEAAKYVPVIRSALDCLDGKSPFRFDVNTVCVRAQRLAFDWRDGLADCVMRRYEYGARPEEIWQGGDTWRFRR